MRRAIDVLQDRGAQRIGFGGISYGAAIGAALIGVDDRSACPVGCPAR